MFGLKVKRKALRYIERLNPDRKKIIKETLLLLKTDPVPARRRDARSCKVTRTYAG